MAEARLYDSESASIENQATAALSATSSQWRSLYYISQGFETPCFAVSKAMVLSRLISHAALPLQKQPLVFPPWHSNPVVLRRFGRALILMAILFGCLGLVANVVAAAYAAHASRLYQVAADTFDSSFDEKCPPIPQAVMLFVAS